MNAMDTVLLGFGNRIAILRIALQKDDPKKFLIDYYGGVCRNKNIASDITKVDIPLIDFYRYECKIGNLLDCWSKFEDEARRVIKGKAKETASSSTEEITTPLLLNEALTPSTTASTPQSTDDNIVTVVCDEGTIISSLQQLDELQLTSVEAEEIPLVDDLEEVYSLHCHTLFMYDALGLNLNISSSKSEEEINFLKLLARLMLFCSRIDKENFRDELRERLSHNKLHNPMYGSQKTQPSNEEIEAFITWFEKNFVDLLDEEDDIPF